MYIVFNIDLKHDNESKNYPNNNIENNKINDDVLRVSYRVFRKTCVFSQFTATPPSPTSL